MKRKREGGFHSHNDGVLQFDFTVKLFSWHHCGGKKKNTAEIYCKHFAVIKRVAFFMGLYIMCVI